jgi:spore maturation protein CgeB
LEKDDQTHRNVMEFLRHQPQATFQEVWTTFFKNYQSPVSGKAISSRHFEPIGRLCCQILLEGHYNGILKPNEHFIAVKKDLSNLVEAIRSFKDAGYRQRIAQQALDHVLSAHTYDHRVNTILEAVLGSAS